MNLFSSSIETKPLKQPLLEMFGLLDIYDPRDVYVRLSLTGVVLRVIIGSLGLVSLSWDSIPELFLILCRAFYTISSYSHSTMSSYTPFDTHPVQSYGR